MTLTPRTLVVQTPKGQVRCKVMRVLHTANPTVYALILEVDTWIPDGRYPCIMHRGEQRTPGTVQIVPYVVEADDASEVVSFVQQRGLFRPDPTA